MLCQAIVCDNVLCRSLFWLICGIIQVTQREPWEHIKDEDIRKAAASFTGEIWQVPPMFSAIKVSLLLCISFNLKLQRIHGRMIDCALHIYHMLCL